MWKCFPLPLSITDKVKGSGKNVEVYYQVIMEVYYIISPKIIYNERNVEK